MHETRTRDTDQKRNSPPTSWARAVEVPRGKPRSRYKPAVLHASAHEALDRLERRYASLKRFAVPAAVSAGALLIAGLIVGDWAAPARTVAYVWAALQLAAALWHRVPPAFAAPDLYRRFSSSIDPLESASEWDEQVIRMTRFGLAISAALALVANDLLRDAKFHLFDELSLDSSEPALRQAVENARLAASNSWFIFEFGVLSVAIAIGVARRLHAVDAVCYANCRSLSARSQPRERWYVLFTAIVLAAATGLTVVISSLLHHSL